MKQLLFLLQFLIIYAVLLVSIIAGAAVLCTALLICGIYNAILGENPKNN
jgi:hypothetical protein